MISKLQIVYSLSWSFGLPQPFIKLEGLVSLNKATDKKLYL